MGVTFNSDPSPPPAVPAAPEPLPDVVPVDPSRPAVAKATSTHIVVGSGVGDWVRGDRIEAADVPSVDDKTGASSIARLVALKAIRALSPAELAQNPPAAPAAAKPSK
jgi:hypothetical protein